jgi:hypothetical protein
MTLWASRDGQTVMIHGNLGLGVKIQESRVSEYTISEATPHLRSFWGSLGRLLEEAEAEQANENEEASL